MFESKQEHAWRKMPVKRDRRHEPLVEKMVTGKDGLRIFPHIKNLMVFAAMIGYCQNRRTPLNSDTINIILETYSSDQKDSYIYLLALITEKKGAVLKDENLNQAITIFEEFCNAGLDVIQLWFDESPSDPTGVDTLFERVYEQVVLNESIAAEAVQPEEIPVEF